MEIYKQKYEHLVKCIKDLYPYMLADCKEKAERIILELEMSEDEKIRKELIKYLESRLHTSFNQEAKICKDGIAWLKKQGELKPIFRVGDYIRNKKTKDRVLIEQIDIANKVYCYVSRDDAAEIHSDFRFSEQNDWEIIGQKIVEQKPNFCHHEVDFSNCSEEYRKAYYDGWNNCNQQHAQLKAEQKSVEWSEEDEKERKRVVGLLEGWLSTFKETCYAEDCKCGIAWLKSFNLKHKLTQL